MALPLLTCEDTALAEGCCTTLFDQATAVLVAVGDVLRDCIPESPCCGEQMRYFVSHARPETWQADYVAVWVENTRIDSRSNRSERTVLPPMVMIQYRLILVESNYPGLVEEGERIFTPTDDEFHLANRHLYAHGQAMLRGLLSYAGENDCTKFLMRDFQPIQPARYTAGWTIGFDLELP